MVVFNCNACGEALKKNQVEKHLSRCRQCQALSCVDCGKDFWGNDYQNHTKCMTEEEKYCGKGYVPKVNKGEAKQEQWIEKVQAAIEKSASNPKLKSLLERLKDYPNIPRKKPKFENFLKNSLRTNNESLINQVWDLLMAAAGQETKQNGTEKSETKQNGTEKSNKVVKSVPDKPSTNELQENGDAKHEEKKQKTSSKGKKDKTESNADVDGAKLGKPREKEDLASSDKGNNSEQQDNCDTACPPDQKLSKRERKEERRKKTNKKEKKDKNVVNISDEVRKGKKRNLSEGEEGVQAEDAKNHGEHSGNKKRKCKHDSEARSEVDNDVSQKHGTSGDENGDVGVRAQKIKKKKFKWESIVLEVLQAKGEMSLKKLRKKVLNEFAAQDAANYSEDNLKAKFDKKINKMVQVKVFKDRVKLK